MQVQANPDDPKAASEAFQQAASPDAMRQAVAQFPVLAQLIPTIQQVINEQVPPEQRPAFEQKLAWLQQIVGDAPPQQPPQDQQEQAIRQLVSVYQQMGENGLRQFLQGQGLPAHEVNQIVDGVKQIIAGGE